jgi:cell division inhibitor SepF
MGVRDLWHRTLVYFGLAEDESLYDDDDDDGTAANQDLERNYRERPNVRRLDRQRRPRESFDEIYGQPSTEAPPSRRSRRGSGASSGGSRGGGADMSSAATAVLRPTAATADTEPVTTAVRVHVIAPRSFNDAQQIADRFKAAVPVIINLQTVEPDLAKRLIDFGSGLTYALDGGMQRIADKVFLLTPRNVEVSAEDRQRLVEQGFFSPG